MKHLDVVLALLVFLGVALAVRLGRPDPPDASLFGAGDVERGHDEDDDHELALTPELAPLVLPSGSLELLGSVRAADGSPAADAFLALIRSEDDSSEVMPIVHAYTGGDGRFRLRGLAPGAYRVVLTHPSAPPRAFALELPVQGEVTWELAAPLPPLPVLPDIVRTGIAGQLRLPETLAGTSTLDGFEVVLSPSATIPLLSGACQRRTTTDANGRFSLSDVVTGEYRVEVLPPWASGGTWPVLSSGTCRAREGSSEPLDLRLEVGALEGELRERDDRPLIGALVRVAALDARDPAGEGQLWPPLVSDETGRFRVELLPAGRYQVFVKAGFDSRELEVRVEVGARTALARLALDPGQGEGQAGGG